MNQSHSPTKVHSCKTIAINVRRSRKGLKCLRVISEVTLNQTRSSIHQSPQLGQFGGYSGNFINACLWPELPTHFISWNYDHDMMIICNSLDNWACTPRSHQEPWNPSPLHEIKLKLKQFFSSSYLYKQCISYLQKECHNWCKTCQHRNSPGSQGC